MAMDWSFSTDSRMRRCERQVFFSNIAACHNARDPLRKESFLLGQLKSLEAWRGLIVHQAVEKLILPYWRAHQAVPWDRVIATARSLGERQFDFSAKRRYRELGMSKKKAEGDYCALFAHEFDTPLTPDDVHAVLDGAEKALRNLSTLVDFLKHIEGRNYYRSETPLSAEYNGVRIKGQVDLIFSGKYGHYGVVDWKDYETVSSSDARRQMSLYAWLMCRSEAWPVSSPGNIELWEVKMGQPVAVGHTVDQDAFDELEDFIYRSTERLKSLCGDGSYQASDLENFAHTENPNSCKFCPYRNICREPDPWIHIASTFTKSKKKAA